TRPYRPIHPDQPTRRPNIPAPRGGTPGLMDDPRPDTAAPLTKAQREAIAAWVARAGRDRLVTQRDRFSEADFLAGGMTVYFALESQGHLPASWLFGGPMTGRSCFTTDGAPPAFGGEPLCFLCQEPIDLSDRGEYLQDFQGRLFCDEGCHGEWITRGRP